MSRRGVGWARPGLLLLASNAAGCGESVDLDPALDAPLLVAGGSYFRGERPEPAGGPRVLGAFLAQSSFRVGEQDKSFSGVVEVGASGVAIALDTEPGYWLVPTGMPFAETPDAPSFSAPLSFSSSVAAGPHSLWLWASNRAGVFGEPARVEFTLVERPLPEGRLVVALRWDTPSDLDLHVLTPDGSEVFNGNLNSWQPLPGSAGDPDAWRAGGILDVDSNAGCRIDGRQNENVIWTQPPPSGSFVVRVDTPSLCGQPGARWFVDVWLDGQRLAGASGSSFESSTRFGHERGAGVLALRFDVP